VFRAWSSAEHIKRWFCPETYTVPEARVEMRVGGPFEVRMRSPLGKDHWSRGVFVEVATNTRLVIDMHAADRAGKPLFRAYTEVDFSDALGGTRMDVLQTYTFIDPSMAEGASTWIKARASVGSARKSRRLLRDGGMLASDNPAEPVSIRPRLNQIPRRVLVVVALLIDAMAFPRHGLAWETVDFSQPVPPRMIVINTMERKLFFVFGEEAPFANNDIARHVSRLDRDSGRKPLTDASYSRRRGIPPDCRR
jgi:uncharacterized protein YndB with AHSA1/START domain